jgi:hypothetical protein
VAAISWIRVKDEKATRLRRDVLVTGMFKGISCVFSCRMATPHVKAAVLLGLGDPSIGIMMESDRVDKRACWASSHAVQAASTVCCVSHTNNKFRSAHVLKDCRLELRSPQRVIGAWCAIEIKVTLGSELLGIERSGFWHDPQRGVAGEDGYATARSNGMPLAMLSDHWPQASRDPHLRHDAHHITTYQHMARDTRPTSERAAHALRTL